MTKLLYISEYFAPRNSIASIRSTKFAKYLSKNHDCQVTVVTTAEPGPITDKTLEADLSHIHRIIKVKETGLILKIWRKLTCNRIIQATPLRYTGVYIYELTKCAVYTARAKKLLRRESHDFEIIISSYAPYSSHYLGRYMKRKNPSAYWVADFRDPVHAWLTPGIFRSWAKGFASRICRKADLVTAVSQGVVDNLFIQESGKTRVFYNGFDKDDLNHLPEIDISNNKFLLGYFGQIYLGKRDLSPLFMALNELINEEKIDPDKIEIIYAGSSYKRLISQIGENGKLLSSVKDYGMLPREKALAIQKKSDILIVASWNEPDEKGIVTGKFLEYLMMDKPILGLISGSLANSKIKEFIETLKVGFCYEEATKENDYEKLKNYLLNSYIEYFNKGNVTHTPNQEAVEQFSHPHIVSQLYKVIHG